MSKQVNTEVQKLMSASSVTWRGENAPSEIKEKLVKFLVGLVELTNGNDKMRARWRINAGSIGYVEGENGGVPFFSVWETEGGYHGQFSFDWEWKRWCGSTDAQVIFSRVELTPFFRACDATGLTAFLTSRVLIVDAERQSRFDEALEAFTPADPEKEAGEEPGS